MKRVLAVILTFVMLFSMAACGNSREETEAEQNAREQTEDSAADDVSEPAADEMDSSLNPETENAADQTEGSGSNILVAYFSRVGNMDFDENVDAVTSASINMNGSDAAGNAELLAGMVQAATGGDLFFIETMGKYPAEYRATTDQAKIEQDNNERPELASHVENMETYDKIVLIYPNWWGTLPQPVFTFLDEYDFSGKTILPLCTHEGSGLGRSESDIAAICPDAQLLEGLSVQGGSAADAQAEVEQWINSSGILADDAN